MESDEFLLAVLPHKKRRNTENVVRIKFDLSVSLTYNHTGIQEKGTVMRNLPFVLWMVGYPLVISIENYLSHLRGDKYDSITKEIAALFGLVTWVYVGTRLY